MKNLTHAAVALSFALLTMAGCSEPIPTATFEELKTKTCACADVACTDAFVSDLVALKHKGGSPEDADKAKTLLTEATLCAVKVDPEINNKIVEALKK